MSEPVKYEFKDIQQVEFSWKMPEKGFIFDDQAECLPMSLYQYPASQNMSPSVVRGRIVPPQVDGPLMLEAPGAKGWIRFNALLQHETKLFIEFAETAPDQERILAFANRWGMLIQGETEVTTPKYPAGSKPMSQRQLVVIKEGSKKQPSLPSLPAESLSFWTREIISMGCLFKVWEWWKNRDLVSLRRVLKWKDNSRAVMYSLPDWRAEAEGYEVLGSGGELLASRKPEHHLEVFKRFKPGSLLLPAQFLLQSRVNAKLKELEDKGIASIRPRLLLDIESKTAPYLAPSNLLAALWLQFLQAIGGERPYKRCEVCGAWEDVSMLLNSDKKPLQRPSRWKGHSSCLNAKHQREWRERDQKKRQRAKSTGRA